MIVICTDDFYFNNSLSSAQMENIEKIISIIFKLLNFSREIENDSFVYLGTDQAQLWLCVWMHFSGILQTSMLVRVHQVTLEFTIHHDHDIISGTGSYVILTGKLLHIIVKRKALVFSISIDQYFKSMESKYRNKTM